MASMITSRVAKHVLKENAKNHFGTEDPYFDYVTPHDLNNNPGKVKRTKKAAPPGITAAEAKILKKVTRRAYRLDNCFTICGIRVGWSAIFGIIPGLGDVFDVLMALMVYRTCCQADIPKTLRTKMMVNIMLDFGIGLVPILGDVADAVFRANTRNAALLYGHLRERGQERMKGGANAVVDMEEGKAGVGVGGGAHAPALENGSLARKEQRMATDRHGVHGVHGQTTGTVALEEGVEHEVRQPESAKVKSGKGGWLSRFTGSGKEDGVARDDDLEAGVRGKHVGVQQDK